MQTRKEEPQEEETSEEADYVDATTDSYEEDYRDETERTHQASFEDYFDSLMKLPFSPITFADENVLRQMAIHDDVHSIFTTMGLGDQSFRAQPGFRELTCKFFASVQTYFHQPRPQDQTTNGYIEFLSGGRIYRLTMSELSNIFRLQQGTDLSFEGLGFADFREVWQCVAQGYYNLGISKSSQIRHPAVCYSHQVLLSIVFSRAAADTVTKEEMIWIIKGIQLYLRYTTDKTPAAGRGDNMCLAAVLMSRFIKMREDVLLQYDNMPEELSIESIITYILLQARVQII